MAQIPTYQASRNIGAAATPQITVSNAVPNALQDLGGAVSSAAATLQQRQAQKDNFTAENSYRRFQLEMQQELENSAQNITPGGQGFHDQFMTQTFGPRRDEFLASVPESLRPRFEEILADGSGADFTDWSVRAATTERDEGYRWAKDEITLTQQQIATAIAMDPDGFDTYAQDGIDLIDSSFLPTPEKELMRRQWTEMAQTAYLNQLLIDDPQAVLRELGVDTRQLSPTTQFEVLTRAVQWQESRDNPDAISPAGAVGLMQVMPATAAEIAGALGDDNFPYDGGTLAIREYLTNPNINKEYGEYYLRQQLRAFANTRNPIETALVAYNAGPSVAQRWVESGYDDRILSSETRNYKTAILDSISAPTSMVDPNSVQFTAAGEHVDLDTVNPDLRGRVADAFATVGVTNVRVISGTRSPEHNEAVGGANQSQHTQANAMDIDVSGMSRAQRLDLIRSLSAAGVTGIGVYANTIHADLGGRRAWGPDHSDDSIPSWASGVLAEHLQGTAPPPVRVAGNLSSLPYDRRQQFLAQADQRIAAQNAATVQATAVEKVQVRRAMDNELATIRATGVPTGTFDETRIASILGEDDYLTYSANRDLAQRTFTAVDGIRTMDTADMGLRLQDYTPVPGSPDFAAQQQVQTAVQREIDRVTRLRSTSPSLAALEFPDVKQMYEELQTSVVDGSATPQNVQTFVETMLDRQAEFGIAPEARAPVPDDWAIAIGQSLSRVPEPARGNSADIKVAIQAQYAELQKYFGEYTDEVIIHALSEYKGVSELTAEVITGYMRGIQGGRDVFAPRVSIDQAMDIDQVDSTSLGEYGLMIRDQQNAAMRAFSNGAPPDTGDTGLSPEEMLRQQPVVEE